MSHNETVCNTLIRPVGCYVAWKHGEGCLQQAQHNHQFHGMTAVTKHENWSVALPGIYTPTPGVTRAAFPFPVVTFVLCTPAQ